MKLKVLLTLLLCSVLGFSQSINDYKAVIIPLKYDFMKTDNQYRLATVTKSNLLRAGFKAYYANEEIPAGLGDRCELLYIDVKKDNAFLVTKLFVELKDCYGKVVYTSEIGKSREKDYEAAYKESLDNAFISVIGQHYKYNGKTITSQSLPTTAPVAATVIPTVDVSDPNLLYAQPTENGYQLIDKTPKVVMKLLKTSRPDSFIAIKDAVQGSLNAKDNGWYFEYYQNDKLVSEKISVKF
ncbi:hypothetical protein L1276_004455 [Flavobacterium sp. HSC-32F16]|uniref:hypothetical protein n=1 Tax=Flavobacterium sp. HSC-32F16 TaxID=2910964 RepID=UPI0020A3A750|nr:hypothetical protein [Flavobacterium sp. HSC-32F16]MCP2029271.1 hypothetical protein [Flavobacterium sp. HSC-32F16]